MNPTITRQPESPGGFFGEMTDESGSHVCYTLERSFAGAPKIPTGQWTCVRRLSPHFQCELFMLTNVPGHDFLEIHPANWESQLDGCIAVGDSISPPMLVSSRDAFNRFMALQAGVDSFTLTVK